jgi:hypothetical protein
MIRFRYIPFTFGKPKFMGRDDKVRKKFNVIVFI